jgi:hypothetical protein
MRVAVPGEAVGMAERIIGEVRSYSQFAQILRAWVAANDTTYETIGAIAGLPDRYLAKMIAATPVRSFSRMSLGSTLAAMGLKLLVAVDVEQLDKMRPRFTPRKKNASDAMLARKSRAKPAKGRNPLVANGALAAFYAHRRATMQTPQTRRRIARAAALARWRNGALPSEGASPAS